MSRVQLSQLKIIDDTSVNIIKKLAGPSTLIITDAYNLCLVRPLGLNKVFAIDNPHQQHVGRILRKDNFDDVIAAGGCTALDVGRACAVGKSLIVIPTILSNACVSSNRSILLIDGAYRSLVTTLPKKTIVPLGDILLASEKDRWKWTSSGVADLFGRFGAVIEYLYQATGSMKLNLKDIQYHAGDAWQGLRWINQRFVGFDKTAIMRVARMLHRASSGTVKEGNLLSSGSEHWLYYTMQLHERLDKQIATHGKIVSVGTLIACKIMSEESGDERLYEELRKGFGKLKLPTNYRELRRIGITKQCLIRNLKRMTQHPSRGLFHDYFSENKFTLLDQIYGKQNE